MFFFSLQVSPLIIIIHIISINIYSHTSLSIQTQIPTW